MSLFRRVFFLLAGAVIFSIPALAQPQPASAKSPIAFFRELLDMSPAERTNALASRPPEIRDRILQKLTEYQIYPGEYREMRLRETELRWYLRPLMDEPKTNRAAKLALIPEDERKIVEERLQLWDILPPGMQEQWRDNDLVANYFAQAGSTTSNVWAAILKTIPADRRQELQQGLDRWQNMSEPQRQNALASFNRFFQLTPDERQDMLSGISAEEREQMKQALAAYGKLTPDQRAQCIDSFEKFATMSVAERQQFLKNADRWQAMTPEERQKWRELVNVAPIMPPAPGAGERRIPTHTQMPAGSRLATN
jgi:hypothetical protein